MVGVAVLMLVTLIWGTTFILTRWIETDHSAPVPASLLVTLRFLVAALLCSPGMWKSGQNARLWVAGAELGFWLWCGYASQAVGLAYTSVGRSAFITSLNVVFVPLLTVLAGRRISGRIWAAAGLALLGTGLLCNDGARPNVGDAWTLVTAITYAVYIIRLEHYAGRFPSVPLTSVQLWAVAFLAVLWAASDVIWKPAELPVLTSLPWVVWGQVFYLGIIATALTTWLQVIGQKRVPGPQASLLYTLEPVWAAFFAWLLGSGESMGRTGWAGAALILAAAASSQLRARDWPALFRFT